MISFCLIELLLKFLNISQQEEILKNKWTSWAVNINLHRSRWWSSFVLVSYHLSVCPSVIICCLCSVLKLRWEFLLSAGVFISVTMKLMLSEACKQQYTSHYFHFLSSRKANDKSGASGFPRWVFVLLKHFFKVIRLLKKSECLHSMEEVWYGDDDPLKWTTTKKNENITVALCVFTEECYFFSTFVFSLQ